MLDGHPGGPENQPVLPLPVFSWAFLPELQWTWHLNSSSIELCLGRICHECPNQVVAPLQARAMHNVFSFHQ